VCTKNAPIFYRVTIEQFAADASAIKRQIGLGMAMGSAALASVMGADEDMAKSFGTVAGNVCLKCSMEIPVAAISEECGSDN